MDEAAVLLSWKGVTVRADGKVRPLIANVTGKVQGGFAAIMGPSGSGKTTLMNALACRLDKHTSTEGEIRLNGSPYSSAELKRLSGYVLQDVRFKLYSQRLSSGW
jgi:ATP-binding cassette, subfamily G (WHITE), member 2